jgi:hypothetical protein
MTVFSVRGNRRWRCSVQLQIQILRSRSKGYLMSFGGDSKRLWPLVWGFEEHGRFDAGGGLRAIRKLSRCACKVRFDKFRPTDRPPSLRCTVGVVLRGGSLPIRPSPVTVRHIAGTSRHGLRSPPIVVCRSIEVTYGTLSYVLPVWTKAASGLGF